MTPFDWASLSLNGSELPPPTVGGSPLTSGGQVAPLSGGGVAVDCASDTFAVTTVTNAAMIGTTERKATLPDLRSVLVNVQSPQAFPRDRHEGSLLAPIFFGFPSSPMGSVEGSIFTGPMASCRTRRGIRILFGGQAGLGTVSSTLHRDDFGERGLGASEGKTHLPFEIDGAHVLLVDDVLYTGRTIRAVVNELFDYGRPTSVSPAS